jgi:acyl-CoA-dependent ceramide synthase
LRWAEVLTASKPCSSTPPRLAFYIHQLVVVSVEARRKDHWQMFSHHVATISLIAGSYLVNMTHVGFVLLFLLSFLFFPSLGAKS